MAKRKYSGINSKSFFSIVVLSASALGLMIATFASLQPTNTQSDASGCDKKPTLASGGVKANDGSITYTYKVSNPKSSDGCKNIFYAFYMTEPSSAWYREYKLNDEPWVSEFDPSGITAWIKRGETPHTIKVKIRPPDDAANKTYSLTANACQGVSSGDGSGPHPKMNCETKKASYVVTN